MMRYDKPGVRRANVGKGDRRRVAHIEDDDWYLAFKRGRKNSERNPQKQKGD